MRTPVRGGFHHQREFSVTEGYLIEGGKIIAPVRGATMMGNGPEILGEIDMVGSDQSLDPGMGMCGKGQSARVSVGEPTVRIPKINVVAPINPYLGRLADCIRRIQIMKRELQRESYRSRH